MTHVVDPARFVIETFRNGGVTMRISCPDCGRHVERDCTSLEERAVRWLLIGLLTDQHLMPDESHR